LRFAMFGALLLAAGVARAGDPFYRPPAHPYPGPWSGAYPNSSYGGYRGPYDSDPFYGARSPWDQPYRDPWGSRYERYPRRGSLHEHQEREWKALEREQRDDRNDLEKKLRKHKAELQERDKWDAGDKARHKRLRSRLEDDLEEERDALRRHQERERHRR
jgi:hypothetical protein